MSKRQFEKKKKVRLASRRPFAFNASVNVFTYGTLMFDDVWRAVVGRLNASLPGQLGGYEAWKIAGQVFPGMAPATGHEVSGRVWQKVTDEELKRLDAFESGIYHREMINVKTAGGGIDCWVYLMRADCRSLLLPEPWDREEFRRLHLATYLASGAD